MLRRKFNQEGERFVKISFRISEGFDGQERERERDRREKREERREKRGQWRVAREGTHCWLLSRSA